MPTPLLRTKLYIPPARPNLVPRTRLTSQLNRGLHLGRKLTLVAAPAGFGKTTLLSTWLAALDRPAGWLALDEHDNDPVRFLAYVIAALQTIYADLGEAVDAMLDGTQPPALDALMTELINEIAVMAEPFVLVLDDYHEIEAPAIHDALAFLLDNQPPNMHLVIASRIDPPVPLARLRVRNQLTELRAGDLRFTAEEAATFLNEAMGLNLSPDDVAALESRTEGWIAGLQLAALSMQGRDDVQGFIDAFTGDDRYVLDYLTEEVLTQQPAYVQDFLLHTSILDRLRGSLCDAVTERDDGRTILEQLEETNLFVVPLDNTRTWYRYHTLFADLLRYRLQEKIGRDGLAALHVRASEWYEANGFSHEAIDHALTAGAFDRAARLIEGVAHLALWERGEFQTLLRWIEQVPATVLHERPQLQLYYAYALAFAAHLDDAETQLTRLEETFETKIPAEVHGQIACIRSFIARLQGDAERAIELAHDALNALSDDFSFWRGATALNLGAVHFSSGNVTAAEGALEEARKIEEANESISSTLATIYILGRLKLLQADLYAAERVYQDGIQYAQENQRGGRLIPTVGSIYAGLGELHYYWNNLDEAEEHLSTGIELGERIGNLSALALGHGMLARLRHVQGDADGVRQSLQRLREIRRDLQKRDVEWAGDELVADEMQIEVLLGNPDATRRWAETFSADTSYMTVNEFLLVSLARVRLAQPQARQSEAPELEQIVSLLTEHIPDTEAAQRLHLALEMLTLKSLVLYALDRSDEAVETLARALALGEPSDYVRIFVDEGKPMVDLLTETLKRQRAGTLLAPADYIADLLTEFDEEDLPEPVVQTAHKAPQPLLEPLTERELDVLELMAEGYTNREIANRLHITVGTVKSHAKNIYGKLDVHSRTQAAARARDLDIL